MNLNLIFFDFVNKMRIEKFLVEGKVNVEQTDLLLVTNPKLFVTKSDVFLLLLATNPFLLITKSLIYSCRK